MKQFEIIEETAGKKFGSFRRFCIETGQDYSNFKRKLLSNLLKIDRWIEPLGLEINIVLQKSKRGCKALDLDIVSVSLPECSNCGERMKLAAYQCKCGMVKEA